MVHVLIVDDQRTGRYVLEECVTNLDGYTLVRSIENAAMAELYCECGRIDLILMDVCTAHGESGLAAAAKIKQLYPYIKIIIVTSMPEYPKKLKWTHQSQTSKSRTLLTQVLQHYSKKRLT